MKKFINNILLIAGILITLILAITMLPMEQDGYLQAYNKKCQLLEDTPSPRIIFVGGSNLAFGLDSQRIKDSLNINVINYGLHAGIGLKYMIDDISTYAKKGDIIVFAPKYEHFYTIAYGESVTLTPLMAVTHWEKINLLDIRQWTILIAGIPQLAKECSLMPKIRSPKDYSVSGFNEYGDETQHWTLESPGTGNAQPINERLDEQFGKYFTSKIKTLQKTCSVYVIPPIYVEKGYHENKKKMSEVEEFLQKEGCPFLVTPKVHVLSDEYAYDTYYHMNRQGVDKYTSFIIEELKPLLRHKHDNFK